MWRTRPDDAPYWLGFHLVPGIGATRLARLVEHFGSLGAAWQASSSELRGSGLNDRAVQALVSTRERISLARELERVEQAGASILTLADDAYPRLLREIPSPPSVLYVKGELTPQDDSAVAVVGTRRASSYGREMTRQITQELAQSRVTVVSGLARGIDAVAHETTLQCEGRTIAVLGSGIDTIYPPEHRSLAERIERGGALVSEFPIGTRPDAANFPVRNRLISGLSLGTVVIEAPQRSGALITTTFAADQGRAVFAVPGSALSPGSAGPLQLLRDGACLVTSGADILAELQLERRQATAQTRQLLPTTELEQALLDQMGSEPRHIDEIAIEAGTPIGQLSALLLQMQLKGFVRNVGAQHYVRA